MKSPASIKELVKFLRINPHVECHADGKIQYLTFEKADKERIYWNNRAEKPHSYDRLAGGICDIEPGIDFALFRFTITKGDKKKIFYYSGYRK